MKIIKIAYVGLVAIFFQFSSANLFAQEDVGLDEAYIEIKSKSLKDDFLSLIHI